MARSAVHGTQGMGLGTRGRGGGMGMGRGSGMGMGRGGGHGFHSGAGRGGGMGAGGTCICTKCGYRMPHQPGVPCREERCPECGGPMVREGSYHHELIEERRKKRAPRGERNSDGGASGEES